MARLARRRTTASVALAGLVLTGCGATAEPAPLERLAPPVPADLCAAVPKDARAGLTASSTADPAGNPTAACSLSSAPGARSEVRAVITWTQLNEEDTAVAVLDSQCRAMDPREYALQRGFRVEGGDKACAGRGRSADSSTIAVLAGREVLTVRTNATPAGQPDAVARGTELAEGVLASLAGG